MILSIPFSGFYESIHDSQIDNELWQNVFTDYRTGCDNNDNLSNRAFDSINWHDLWIEYSREYVDFMAHEYDLKIEFESLSSPREYNFVTDRIFVNMPDCEFLRIYNEIDKKVFADCIKSHFTSYDGFISFYSNDINEWPENPLDYDCNEAMCLFEAWLIDNHEFDLNDFELRFIESNYCDGFYHELIYKHCENKRLFKIHDYLNKRAERV